MKNYKGMQPQAALALCLGILVSQGAAGASVTPGGEDGANWLSYGRTLDEQRFSPLRSVNDANVAQLGLSWSADLDTARGQEATPLIINGVLYVSTAWSMVKAYDAVTGKLLWSYDPKVPREKLVDVCCDAVNRGVAAYQGRIYVATLDGRLVALRARTGAVIWEKPTIPAGSHMAITGAPRIVKGKVLIGSAGSEYISRGYIAAYDARTGQEAWRFYTVPGDPAKGFESDALKKAAATWSGQWWKVGGGGTVWDAITYDPQSNLVYLGTGNAAPWNAHSRSPEGGDNLYTGSIIALNPDSGKLVWYFQETPEDRWDFDSAQQIIAATIPVNGKPRRVILHAPKNGFFYVLDAGTGKFISGKPFATVTWTNGLDPATGRPDIVQEARYEKTGKPYLSLPGAMGAHSWQSMSYSPTTGLVYIPANNIAQPYFAAPADWQPQSVGYQTGLDTDVVSMPADAKVRAQAAASVSGSLLAWDPVTQQPRWSVPYAGPNNGGTLSTAGNLVFQGTAGGEFRAYAADSGTLLWSFPTQTGVIAAPATYSVGGVQYVAVLAGWGGVYDLASGILAGKSGSVRNISRLLVFKLGGEAQLAPLSAKPKTALDPPPAVGSAIQVADGAHSYGRSCTFCHGDAAIAGGLTPDLRRSAVLGNATEWQQIVHDGVLKEAGMVGWAADYSHEQIENIRLYVVKRANEDRALEAH